MKRLFSQTMLAALIISLVPAQSAQADWSIMAKCFAITGSATAAFYALGWAQDIISNQHEIKYYRRLKNERGVDSNITVPERDRRPGEDARWYGLMGLIYGSVIALSYAAEKLTRK